MRNARLFLGRTLGSITVLLYFTGFTASPLPAAASNETSPASVIQKYCKLDLGGDRLASQTPYEEAITALATWPNELGWDAVVVVSDFKIVSTILGPKESSVTVRYFLLGTMFGAKITPSNQHKEVVTFILTKSPNGWLIERPLIAPHVSVSTAISAVNGLLKDEKGPGQIKRLNAGIDVLTKWKSEAGLSAPAARGP